MNEQENVFSNVPVEPKKSKRKFILGGLLVLIVIAVIALLVWYFTKGKETTTTGPVEVYQSTVIEGFELLSNNLKKLEGIDFSSTEPVEVTLNAKLTTTMSDLVLFNGLTLDSKIGLDLNKKEINLDLDLSKNGKGLDVTLALINNHGYFKSTDLLDKTLDLGVLEGFDFDVIEMPEVDIADLEYVINTYKDIFKNAITASDCEVSNTYNEGKIYTYNITSDLVNRLMNNISTTTLNDNKLLEILSSYTDLSASEISSALEELKDEDYSDFTNAKLVIETDGSEVTNGYLEVSNEKLLSFTNSNNETVITFGEASSQFIITFNDDDVKLSYSNEDTSLELSVTSDDSSCSLTLKTTEENDNITINLNLKNMVNNSDSLSADFVLSINGSYEGEALDLSLDGSYGLKKSSITSLDITNAVSSDELTEDEANEFVTNLLQVINDLGLSSLLS